MDNHANTELIDDSASILGFAKCDIGSSSSSGIESESGPSSCVVESPAMPGIEENTACEGIEGETPFNSSHPDTLYAVGEQFVVSDGDSRDDSWQHDEKRTTSADVETDVGNERRPFPLSKHNSAYNDGCDVDDDDDDNNYKDANVEIQFGNNDDKNVGDFVNDCQLHDVCSDEVNVTDADQHYQCKSEQDFHMEGNNLNCPFENSIVGCVTDLSSSFHRDTPVAIAQRSSLDIVYESENSDDEDNVDNAQHFKSLDCDHADESNKLTVISLTEQVGIPIETVSPLAVNSHSAVARSDLLTRSSTIDSSSVYRESNSFERQSSSASVISSDGCAASQQLPASDVKSSSPSDYFDIDGHKVDLRPPKPSLSTKRVNSFRKSLIKLGSFGREHSFVKDKHKKDKDKPEKNKPKEKNTSIKERTPTEPLLRSSFSWDSSTGGHLQLGANQRTPEQRPTAGLTSIVPQTGQSSPAPNSSKRISEPIRADEEVQHKIAEQKWNYLQQMYEQVLQEYSALKADFDREPTELNHCRLEQKQQVMQRLKSQLSSNARSPSVCGEQLHKALEADAAEGWTDDYERRRLSLDADLLSQRSALASLPPHPPVSGSSLSPAASVMSSTSMRQRGHQKTSSLSSNAVASQISGCNASNTGDNSGALESGDINSKIAFIKKDVTLSRSHSDSYRRIRRLPSDDGLRQTASNDELQNLRHPPIVEPGGVSSVASSTSSDSVKHPRIYSISGGGVTGDGTRRSRSKSQEMGSVSDDNADSGMIGPGDSSLSPVTEHSLDNNSIFDDGGDSLALVSGRRQANIMGMEEDEFSSEEDNGDDQGVFNSFLTIRSLPAHLAVFLHYLISNSNPSPLLFYIITDIYSQHCTKDTKEMRKWAYEIFSSFLVDKAPLKVSMPEEIVANIENLLLHKHDKEDSMRSIFFQARSMAANEVSELLADFRLKRALGLGSIYGDKGLLDHMDSNAILKTFDDTLWIHFQRFQNDEKNESNLLMASALATFFKHYGYSKALLDKCPTFVALSKRMGFSFSRPKTKTFQVKSHNLQQQQYTSSTFCHICQEILWGVGYQGFQCTKCELNAHKRCLDAIKETCTGKKAPTMASVLKPKPRPQSVVKPAMIPVGKPPVPAANKEPVSQQRQQPTDDGSVSHRDEKSEEETNENSREELIRRQSDEHKPVLNDSSLDESPHTTDNQYESFTGEGALKSPTHPASFTRFNEDLVASGEGSGASAQVIFSALQQTNDSDLETEAELPPLESFVAKDVLRKLKPKEKKRQDVINELFYTERAHVRNLKVMQQLFYRPMINDPTIASPEFVRMLFPNIDDMVRVHSALNNEFKRRKSESQQGLVDKVSDILVRKFTGAEGASLGAVCATFCQNQAQVLERLRAKQRSTKDAKFVQFLLAAQSEPLCRRLALKDFLPTAMQRLTKYPLLIEKLLSYASDSNEIAELQAALVGSKKVLGHVNHAVQECENRHKLEDFQKRLDKKQFETGDSANAQIQNFDFTKHRLIHEGQLMWRLSKQREIDVHAVLLEHAVILLQRQDEKLILKYQNKEDRINAAVQRHSPVIELSTMLSRSVANDKRALYIISSFNSVPQIYELVASSKDDRNKWLKYIQEAAAVYKDSNPFSTPPRSLKSGRWSTSASESLSQADESIGSSLLTVNEVQTASSSSDAVTREQDEVLSDHNDQVLSSSSKAPDVASSGLLESDKRTEDSPGICLDKLNQTNELIHQLLNDKRRMLGSLLHIDDANYDAITELTVESSGDKDPSELVLASLTLADQLTRIANNRLDAVERHVSIETGKQQHVQMDPNSILKTVAEDDFDGAASNGAQSSTGPTAEHGVDNKQTDVKFPLVQLIDISSKLQQNLTQLLKMVISPRGIDLENQNLHMERVDDQLTELTEADTRRVPLEEHLALHRRLSSPHSDASDTVVDITDLENQDVDAVIVAEPVAVAIDSFVSDEYCNLPTVADVDVTDRGSVTVVTSDDRVTTADVFSEIADEETTHCDDVRTDEIRLTIVNDSSAVDC